VASAAGTYVPVFTYGGDGNYAATAPTSGYTTTVAKATPTVGVVAASASAALGTTLTFTATVTGPANAIAPSALGSWAITGVPGLTSCSSTTGPTAASNVATYTCSVVASLAGNYTATFTFTGDSAYNAVGVLSSSPISVAAALPTLLLTSTSTPTLGGSLTFTATVTGVINAAAPIGVMSFALSGSANPVSCNTRSGPITNGIISTYTCVLLTPSVGTYIARANLAADSNYTSASSNSLTLTLVAQAPLITLAASPNPTLGSPLTLTTTVTGIAGAVQSTGAVSWLIKDPTNVTVSNSCTTTTFTAVSANVSTYTCAFTPTIASTYHITSTIAADSNYLTATSSTLPINFAAAQPQVLLSASPTTTTVGIPITFTANVVGVGPNPAPTGSITWNVTGAATSCTASTTGISVGLTTTYTCQIATPIAGTYTVRASYNGDANYSSQSSLTALSVSVTKATPTIAITTAPTTPVLGDSLIATATISGIVGATAPAGAVSWSVTGAATTCTSAGAMPQAHTFRRSTINSARDDHQRRTSYKVKQLLEQTLIRRSLPAP